MILKKKIIFINEVILEKLQTDGYNLEKELIFKILNLESEIIDF